MGRLHDQWKAAKSRVKKSDVVKNFKESLGDALDKLETKRADLAKRLERLPDDVPMTRDEGSVYFKENDDIGAKASKILLEYVETVTKARKKYAADMAAKKDKAKEEATVKFNEMEGLLRALMGIRGELMQSATDIRTAIAAKKGLVKKGKDGKMHV